MDNFRKITLPPFAALIILLNLGFSIGLVEFANVDIFFLIIWVFIIGTFAGVAHIVFMIQRKDDEVTHDFFLSMSLAVISMLLREENRLLLFSKDGVFPVVFLILLWFGSIRLLRIGFRK